jgi:hypothetical protein
MSEYDVRLICVARDRRSFRYRCCHVRAAKTTKEIEASELEQLTRPEARATAAFDAAELQGLLDQSRLEDDPSQHDDDDLAIPVAKHVIASSLAPTSLAATSKPGFATSSNPALATPSNPALAASSNPATREPAFAAASGEITPFAASSGEHALISASADATQMPTASLRAVAAPDSTAMARSPRAITSPGSSTLIPMTTDFEEPGHFAEPPIDRLSSTDPSSSTVPARVARGSARTPKAHRPLTKPSEARGASLLPWLVVALAATVVFALAMWR